MMPDEFDAWAQLKFAIRELEQLAATLGSVLGADDETGQAATWDASSYAAVDLLERTYADIGTLSAAYLRCAIIDRRGTDPLA